MRFKVIFLALFIPQFSFAHSLFLDTRLDYNSTSYQDSTLDDSAKFVFKTGRLDALGEISPELKYRVRWTFNKNGDATNNPDSAQTALEYAFLTQKFSDTVSLSLGKMNSDFGGFEGGTSGADLYLTSEYYTRRGVRDNLSDKMANTSKLLYVTGAKLTYETSFNTVHLLVTNESNDSKVNGPVADQNSNLMGLIWRARNADKSLQTNVSYHRMQGTASDDIHHFMTLGTFLKFGRSSISLDLLGTELTSDINENQRLTSVVAKWFYEFDERWNGRLEFTASQEGKTNAREERNFRGIGLVAEYKPLQDKINYRYHFAINRVTESESGLPDAHRDEIIVGMRLFHDFLK